MRFRFYQNWTLWLMFAVTRKGRSPSSASWGGEKPNTSAEALKMNSSTPHMRTHKITETFSLSFSITRTHALTHSHTHFITFHYLWWLSALPNPVLCCSFGSAANTNPASWKTILLWFSWYFSFLFHFKLNVYTQQCRPKLNLQRAPPPPLLQTLNSTLRGTFWNN